MEQSALLMSAKIHFVEAKLSLVHVPLSQYERYIPTILKLLFPTPADGTEIADISEDVSYRSESWANRHAFLNVSVTPLECSIVCESQQAEKLFGSAFKHAQASEHSITSSLDQGSISKEDFVVISVEGAGMEAGQRVLELTTPLALAGM